MKAAEQKAAAKAFAEYWKGKGYEKGESQPFWLSLLRDVYGVEHPEQYIIFEDQVHLDHTSFIDGFIPSTHVLIEQKGQNKDLRKPIKQSDGSLLNPFQQAKRYAAELPYSQRPRWIVTSNFTEFLVYDMENPSGEPEQILLSDLPKEYYRLQFLVDTGDENIRKEMEVSIQAGNLVGVLYDEILKQYINPESEDSLKSLNMLCVRLVFCLYAEDAGIFGEHGKFHDYIKSFSAKDMRRALIDLFKVLDTKIENRDPYMDELLASFPYVNGGLFADEDIEIPQFNDTIRDLLLQNASEDFDWSAISPTIFGAVFESTLNPETRRSGGMHYTSIENIHKVIDPLFLDGLHEELEEIKELKVEKTRNAKLRAFQDKLSSLTFLDPACGSGNFLTETYISLRKLENEVIDLITQGQIILDMGGVIKVSIGQFYGIEINDFAVTVAKTALWIAESQMMKETEDIVHMNLDFLPLKSYANIVEGNALRIDWEIVVPKEKLNYIMGNPPFVANGGRVSQNKGSSHGIMTQEQKQDRETLFGNNSNTLDYVACWFMKASKFIQDTKIRCAFVATNSICQGQQVEPMWKPISALGITIDFAWQSFKWESEATAKATVFVVIVGFSYRSTFDKKIYAEGIVKKATEINGYLKDAPLVFVSKRTKPLCNVPVIIKGSQPTDGGNLIISKDEYDEFIKKEPESRQYIRTFLGGEEFINGKTRYCLWLQNVSPASINKLNLVKSRIAKVRDFRLQSKKEATRKWADYPSLFTENRQPETNFIAIPEVSSGNRRYIPIDFLTPDIICSNKLQMIPNATIYHLGVLTSNVHMAWMRTTCGYYGPSYDYSAKIVYNNFPWPNPTEEQKVKIEQTAQAILDARALYPDCSLADLYDELTMPIELRKAHQANDRAVMQAYGFDVKSMTESTCVAELMKMYQDLTK